MDSYYNVLIMNFGIDYVLVYLMYSKYVLLSNVFFIPPSLL